MKYRTFLMAIVVMALFSLGPNIQFFQRLCKKYTRSSPDSLPAIPEWNDAIMAKYDTSEDHLVHTDGADNDGIDLKSRAQLLTSQCENMSAHNRSMNRDMQGWIIRAFDHKLFMCPVAKAGSTFWRTAFSLLFRGYDKTKTMKMINVRLPSRILPFAIQQLTTVKRRRRHRKRYANFSRMMFVRNPYRRLYATYVDKLIVPNLSYWAKFGSEYRGNLTSNDTLGYCRDATFSDFIKYVINAVKSEGDWIDVHIVPISWVCGPCVLNYTLIGKAETFMKDSKEVLTDFGFDQELIDLFVRAYNRHEIYAHIVEILNDLYNKNMSECVSDASALDRLWDSLKRRGRITANVRPPVVAAVARDGRLDIDLLERNVVDAIADSRHQAKERVAYKMACYIDAYRSVSWEDKMAISRIYDDDFEFFGYEKMPSELYPTTA